VSKRRSDPVVKPDIVDANPPLPPADVTNLPSSSPVVPGGHPEVLDAAMDEQIKAAVEPALAARRPFRHPNLGLAPVDMRGGFPDAAARLRAATPAIAVRALENAATADATLTDRYDETGLRRLLRDAELLTQRLAMCLGSANTRWLSEYAEWIVPVYRRRGVSLLDVAAICDGLGHAIGPDLGTDEREMADRSLAAATAVLRRDSRLAGDRHQRNALWKWMYKGV
jgi:hypothetical protein